MLGVLVSRALPHNEPLDVCHASHAPSLDGASSPSSLVVLEQPASDDQALDVSCALSDQRQGLRGRDARSVLLGVPVSPMDPK